MVWRREILRVLVLVSYLFYGEEIREENEGWR
jgi:hypothetical protein